MRNSAVVVIRYPTVTKRYQALPSVTLCRNSTRVLSQSVAICCNCRTVFCRSITPALVLDSFFVFRCTPLTLPQHWFWFSLLPALLPFGHGKNPIKIRKRHAEEFLAESVVVLLDIRHFSRGDLEIKLISPQGTESILTPGSRPENTQLSATTTSSPSAASDDDLDQRWKLMTVRNWGESAIGDWKLVIRDLKQGDFAGDCADAPYSNELQVLGTTDNKKSDNNAQNTIEMRCFSMNQPFAALLANCYKTLETRNGTMFAQYAEGTQLLLHIGQCIYPDGDKHIEVMKSGGLDDTDIEKLKSLPQGYGRGSIIAILELGKTYETTLEERCDPEFQRNVGAYGADSGRLVTEIK